MGKTKYTPAKFKRKYAPLKARGLDNQDIARSLQVSYRTLLRYLDNPEYVINVSQMTQNYNNNQIEQGRGRSEEILDTAFKLHKKGIHDALFDTINGKDVLKQKPNYEKARQISLDALKIAMTDTQIQKTLIMIGSVNIDNRQVNITQVQQECFSHFWNKICNNCKKKLKEETK